ncbi:MAG: DNA alkylation repair protein [Candidatus Pacebacteria bacterium]|nr:DNA alkylation repair protein [Candidatus Paceibacterota bacterium]
MDIDALKNELKDIADKEQAFILSRFFKTGKGGYGEGDVFLGIKVPETRKIAKKYYLLGLKDIQKALDDDIHEIRFAALVVLLEKYKRSESEKEKKDIFDFYIKNIRKSINNWDLVDLSCPQLVGDFLFDKPKDVLYRLSLSENLWERRVSIISTFYFIKNRRFDDTLNIAERLLQDKEDLIHKAVGWMLREVGKRDIEAERDFLKKHYRTMPRTSLRYAIEKMEEEERQEFLRR